jgi:hypothetical protein
MKFSATQISMAACTVFFPRLCSHRIARWLHASSREHARCVASTQMVFMACSDAMILPAGLCVQVAIRQGIKVRFIEIWNLDKVKAALGPNTKVRVCMRFLIKQRLRACAMGLHAIRGCRVAAESSQHTGTASSLSPTPHPPVGLHTHLLARLTKLVQASRVATPLHTHTHTHTHARTHTHTHTHIHIHVHVGRWCTSSRRRILL